MQTGIVQVWALGAMLFCLVFFPFILARSRNNAGAGVMAAACGLGAVMLFLPQVQSLQFGPLKAEMREVREKIQEASATLDELRSLAADFARVAVLGALGQGSIGGPSIEDAYTIRKNIERQLTTLHINQTEIENILRPLNSQIEMLIERDIEFSARKPDSGESLFNCLLPEYKSLEVDKIRNCIEKFGTTTYSVEENLKKLSEFQKTRHIRGLEINTPR